ncbi:glycosyltransferase family 39 protein [Chloroflexi bacterium TSY]|nr:glycosyltransferase family 39 protein [Chloroflexi bacterium TSY]
MRLPTTIGTVEVKKYVSVSAICLLVLLWRFYQIRTLTLPAWVDSVHHTLLVRILLEQGKIPDTWAPYLPQTPFYYHFGFHASTVVFAKLTGLTGLDLGRAVLLVGQLWQVLLVLSIYLLGRSLWQQEEKALTAMLLVTFVSQMPAYYVTWGRYTLLAGLTLMVLSMAAALTGRRFALAVLTAATAITHHYAFFLLVPFLTMVWLLVPIKRWSIGIGGALGCIIASPWLWRVWTHGWRHVGLRVGEASFSAGNMNLWALLGPERNYLFLLIAGVGLGIVIKELFSSDDSANLMPSTQKKSESTKTPKGEEKKTESGTNFARQLSRERANMAPLVGWSLFIVGLMGPWKIGPFRPDHAAIVLFVPAVLMATEAIWSLKWPRVIWYLVLLLLLLGMWDTRNILRPGTVFASANDLVAIRWVDEQTSPTDTFLIDVEPWFGRWRGIDGGWWITPLTGRHTVLPPLAYGWSEPDVFRQIVHVAEQIDLLYCVHNSEYCGKLKSLMQQTDADYYHTYTTVPQQCSFIQPVYDGMTGIYIYKRGIVQK